MQNKKPLRFINENHAVYQEVEAHFLRKQRELPPEWEALVAMACFPSQVVEQPNWTSDDPKKLPPGTNFMVTPLKDEVRAFQACFAREPDLTLEILALAREHLARFNEKNCVTQDGCARAFVVKYGQSTIISENGELRLPRKNEFVGWTHAELLRGKRRGMNVKIVPVATLQDGQIAQLLTAHHKFEITTASVSQARRSLSTVFNKKGKPYYFAKGLLKAKKKPE
jgi:hypothetical protein